MSHGQSDADIIRTTHNTARFFTVNRQFAVSPASTQYPSVSLCGNGS